MRAGARQRFAHTLATELEHAREEFRAAYAADGRQRSHEEFAIGIDGGLGMLAIAALVALPRGPMRTVEAARWARRALDLGLDQVCVLIQPGWSDEHVDSHGELLLAIERAREAA